MHIHAYDTARLSEMRLLNPGSRCILVLQTSAFYRVYHGRSEDISGVHGVAKVMNSRAQSTLIIWPSTKMTPTVTKHDADRYQRAWSSYFPCSVKSLSFNCQRKFSVDWTYLSKRSLVTYSIYSPQWYVEIRLIRHIPLNFIRRN